MSFPRFSEKPLSVAIRAVRDWTVSRQVEVKPPMQETQVPASPDQSLIVRTLLQCLHEPQEGGVEAPNRVEEGQDTADVVSEAQNGDFEGFEDVDAEPEPKPQNDHAYRKLIGQRMVAAREMNGINQIVAASMLGYKRPAPLSKIEAGITEPPRWLIPKAAQVFGVSSDFLLGLSEYPERDPRTVEQIALLCGIRETMERNARAVAESAILAAREVIPLKRILEDLLPHAVAVSDALHHIRQDGVFDDEIRGGAKLVGAVDRLDDIVQSAFQNLHRILSVQEIVARADANLPTAVPTT